MSEAEAPDTADAADAAGAADEADTAGAAFRRGGKQLGSTIEVLAAQRAKEEAKVKADKAEPRPLLLALGDSWFAYWPRGDILDVLEDRGQLGLSRRYLADRGGEGAKVERDTHPLVRNLPAS